MEGLKEIKSYSKIDSNVHGHFSFGASDHMAKRNADNIVVTVVSS